MTPDRFFQLRVLVAETFDCAPYSILSRQRFQAVNEARHAFAFILRTRFGLTYQSITRAMRRKCHGTAINSVQRAKELISIDPDFASKVSTIKNTPLS